MCLSTLGGGKVNLKNWNCTVGKNKHLNIAGVDVIELAKKHKTPFHIADVVGLKQNAVNFMESFRTYYPAKTDVYYALKCNSIPGTVKALHSVGVNAEVMSPFEFHVTQKAGVPPKDVIVNGPAKTDEFLRLCVSKNVRLIIVDSLHELKRLESILKERNQSMDILLRINMDFISGEGLGAKSAFGFALDDSFKNALTLIKHSAFLCFQGVHSHFGTAVKRSKCYQKSFNLMTKAMDIAREEYGFLTKFVDLGGGFGVPTVKMYTDFQFIKYHGFWKLPPAPKETQQDSFGKFAQDISSSVQKYCKQTKIDLPTLILEPGSAMSSSSQILVLNVLSIKTRGKQTWAITDGGLLKNFPTFFAYHEVLSCRDPLGKPVANYNIIGSGCFAADSVLHSKNLPLLQEGDFLAVMDSGAYFTSFEGNFSYPKPAILAVDKESQHMEFWRQPESYEHMLSLL